MPLDADSYHPQFFTEARLEHYRGLATRFPLWCGDWMANLQVDPVASRWSPPHRVESTLRANEGRPSRIRALVFDGPASKTRLPSPQFYKEEAYELDTGGWGSTQPSLTEVEPKVFAAWFGAVNYAGHNWKRSPAAALGLPNLRDSVQELGARLSEAFSTLSGRKPSGFDLLRLRSALLTALSEGQGKTEAEELRKAWAELGENIDLIPVSQGGGLKLPNEFLRQLFTEAEQIAREVKAWSAPDADMDEVRSLMVHPSVPQHIRALLKEKRGISAASAATHLGGKYSPEIWALALQFPLLDIEEVRLMLEAPKKTTQTEARRLLVGRLPITEKTLGNRLRKKS